MRDVGHGRGICRCHELGERVRVHEHAVEHREGGGSIGGADRRELAGIEMARGEPELATRLAQRDHDGGLVGGAEDRLDPQGVRVEEEGGTPERAGAQDRIHGPCDDHGRLVRHGCRDGAAAAGVEALEDAQRGIEGRALDELVEAVLEHGERGRVLSHDGLLGLGLVGAHDADEQRVQRADRLRQGEVARDLDSTGSLDQSKLPDPVMCMHVRQRAEARLLDRRPDRLPLLGRRTAGLVLIGLLEDELVAVETEGLIVDPQRKPARG